MIYEYQVNGLTLQAGDLICTADGNGANIKGQFWRLVGRLIPGNVDHIVVYVDRRGVAWRRGPKASWPASTSSSRRLGFKKDDRTEKHLIDKIYGAAYPSKEGPRRRLNPPV